MPAFEEWWEKEGKRIANVTPARNICWIANQAWNEAQKPPVPQVGSKDLLSAEFVKGGVLEIIKSIKLTSYRYQGFSTTQVKQSLLEKLYKVAGI